MFVPLHDDTPLRVIRFQYVTGAIILADTILFLMTGAFANDQSLWALASTYGVTPAQLTNMVPYAGRHALPEPLTLFTYQFLHAGWMHLISNMLFLWVFADNIEDAFGHGGFAIFFVLCGIAGGLMHSFLQPHSSAPLIGASGAVSGVMAAYLLLFPRAHVWILLFLRIPMRISAFWAVGGWFVLQLVSIFFTTQNDVEVAWWAHVGGFLAGLVLTVALRSRLFIKPSA
ncbi:rhomboid family intramembrane serine protease [soil metagenome]